jgi:hypothetical protein
MSSLAARNAPPLAASFVSSMLKIAVVRIKAVSFGIDVAPE